MTLDHAHPAGASAGLRSGRGCAGLLLVCLAWLWPQAACSGAGGVGSTGDG